MEIANLPASLAHLTLAEVIKAAALAMNDTAREQPGRLHHNAARRRTTFLGRHWWQHLTGDSLVLRQSSFDGWNNGAVRSVDFGPRSGMFLPTRAEAHATPDAQCHASTNDHGQITTKHTKHTKTENDKRRAGARDPPMARISQIQKYNL